VSVFVCGLGAVSPAGWGMSAMREALEKGQPLPIQPLSRPGWQKSLRSRDVPPPPSRPACLAHPRLRRTSPISHYAAVSAMEAVSIMRANGQPDPRIGVIVCLHSGCVQYTCRFFEETLRDPATASPLLFPETVFAAPASHVAALLGNAPLVYSLVGDPASYLQGLALATDWLENGRVDACVVVGAEETNWMRADALWHLDRGAIISEGAGALCLSLDPAVSLGVELAAITDAHTFRPALGVRASRQNAAHAMRRQLPPCSPSELLCDGLGNSPRTDLSESSAWRDWTGPRLSLKRVLGEGLMAGAAWQCIAAADAIARGQFSAANISLVGCNQQAIGSRFVRDNARNRPA
jgi:hypothetical protein